MKLFRYIRRLFGVFLLISSAQAFAVGSASAANLVNDSAITAKVKMQLLKNPATKDSEIHVETNNGVVTLKGEVESDTAASTAVQIAESTKNVVDVDTSDLDVQNSTQPLQDTYITAKVNGMLIREKLFNNSKMPISQIKVETKNGVVYLSGHVSQQKQVQRAVELAKSVAGVRDVVSNIVIKIKN